MRAFAKLLTFVFLSGVIVLQGCSGVPVKMGVSAETDLAEYDLENPELKSISASGFQLALFIPIVVNNRHERAYAALQREAGDGLIGDVRITESWTYAFVGTVYKTTIHANVYPRKK